MSRHVLPTSIQIGVLTGIATLLAACGGSDNSNADSSSTVSAAQTAKYPTLNGNAPLVIGHRGLKKTCI